MIGLLWRWRRKFIQNVLRIENNQVYLQQKHKYNHGFKKHDIPMIEAVIEENKDVITDHWKEYFKEEGNDRLYVTRVWTDNGELYAETDNGITATYDLRKEFKGFRNATASQIDNFEVSWCGIHWSDLNEDINLESMFHDNHLCQLTRGEDSVVYRPIPESHDVVAEL